MEISALTRSVVKRNHAVIAPDGYINSNVPGWENCTVNVIINEQMGANLCQTLITAAKGCKLSGLTKASQIFFYVVEGSCTVSIGSQNKVLTKGQFVYVPIGKEYLFDGFAEGSQLLTFHKVYEYIDGYDVPDTYFGDAADIEGPIYMNDDALRIQVLLPPDLSFDMAVNIFTYQTGGNLPMVETHIMEHGLLYLQGQGIYMLDHEWYPIKKGDSIWMAPYCQQWFTAMGKEPAVYIYYKNVNRFPTTI
ncbi:(S)-ureidoglycine aminohydrolase [Mucilaginibacter gracilis]|uniref:(S)-ureidoglycine aminohydrolase n=1 Tax=Mucilaginibacter gracilis TaxID=423350 RepID=A0A495J4A7_9SPHI|nr:(S)-ureidoglycine aminohydrolase [Mucilaginibacter gracilis]RKR83810.1 (S)-ureidoglycine aminohydrolase [Mucilaginibacter gracilis]